MAEMREPLAATAGENAFSPPFGRRDWAFLTLAAAAAVCFSFAHSLLTNSPRYHLPGVGLTLTQWIIVSLTLFTAKREKRLPVTFGGVFLLMAALGLGACYGLYADDALRLMNLPVTVLATSLALFSLTGVTHQSPLSGPGIREGCRCFLPAIFRHLNLPFQALKDRKAQRGPGLNGIGLGLLLGVPVAGAALWLLASADGMFQLLLEKSTQWLGEMDVSVLLRLGVAVLGTLFLFSYLFSTTHPWADDAPSSQRTANPVTYFTVLLLLAAVYALFVYIQFRYLFGGGEIAQLKGGYANYARSGFFQLVLLAILTLALILPALTLCPDSKPLRSVCAVVALLTGVIDFSAFFRMRLYIQAYGYTLLRVVTMWGIGMIGLALIGVIVKSIRPVSRICPALTVLALTTWLILNLSNPAVFIAQRNLTVYRKTTPADLRYVISLSPDVLPLLDQIDDPGARDSAWAIAQEVYEKNRPVPYDWSLGWLNVSKLSNDE